MATAAVDVTVVAAGPVLIPTNASATICSPITAATAAVIALTVPAAALVTIAFATFSAVILDEVLDLSAVFEAMPFGLVKDAPLARTLLGGLDLLLVDLRPAPQWFTGLGLCRQDELGLAPLCLFSKTPAVSAPPVFGWLGRR